MTSRSAGTRFHEDIRREELLATLNMLEDQIDAPFAPPQISGAWEIEHVASALEAWIEASDGALHISSVEDFPGLMDGLTRYRSAQRESLQDIRRIAAAADDADSPEQLLGLVDRARDAVATACRNQTRKRNLVERCRSDLGGID